MESFRDGDAATLGAALRELRTAKGLSLAQTARLSGVSRASIADWEADRHLPGGPALAGLLQALDAAPAVRADLLVRAKAEAAQAHVGRPHLGPPVVLGDALRALRARGRRSQAAAARAVGVGQSTWAKWETGDALPSEATLERILEAFGASERERAALRSVVWTGLPDPGGLESFDRRVLDVEHLQPLDARGVLLFGIEAEAWRRSIRGENGGEAALCRAIAAQAQQCLLRGELDRVEPLTQRALVLARASGEMAWATPAVASLEWLRQRTPGGAAASAHRLGEWAEGVRRSRYRYWAGLAHAYALARAGELEAAIERHARLPDEDPESHLEAVYHPTSLAEIYLLADAPERARAEVAALGELAPPLFVARVHLALGETPSDVLLQKVRARRNADWIARCEVEAIERALADARRGRRVKFR